MDLDRLIEDAKVLAKEKDTLARTFRGFKDYGNPKSTITSGAEKAQKESEQYEHISKLFEELKQYRAIGTIEEFKALKEKNTPKKVKKSGVMDSDGVFHATNGINGVPYDLCPNCEINLCTDGMFGENTRGMKYCKNCGQKLDWK